MVRVRSMKTTELVRSEVSHSRPWYSLRRVLKPFQAIASSRSFSSGSQIPIMSSMNRRKKRRRGPNSEMIVSSKMA